MMPNRPGMRFFTTNEPTSGEKVTPSDSNLGQTMMTPMGWPAPLAFEMGHASSPVSGSSVPFKALVSGSLNMSYVI